MSTKKTTTKTPVKKDDLTPAEKKMLSRAAKTIKKSHEGSPKPQLLTKLNADDQVPVTDFPMVRWNLINGNCIRETDTLNIKCKAKDVEGFKKMLSDPGMRKDFKNRLQPDLYEKSKYSLNEISAILQARRRILRKIEKLEIDVRFEDQTGITLGDVKEILGTLCRQLRALDEWETMYTTILDKAKEDVDVIPDPDKFTFDDETGKFYLNEDYKKLVDDRLAQLKKKD